ncbi:hypothetical protein ES288_D01G258200v1 [Gossypium darwinii]|uniref:Uncharacterized protein n=1 Tax=Gossypium darwinii TaxID=34276 RepID=A0A5D2DUC3_GOSDA|nr:hypothetical protein ES288_D01G258200v1 [Gossypium darwinii]
MIHRHDIKSKYWICVYWWLRIWKVCLTCTCMRIEVATEEVLNNSICTSCIPFLVDVDAAAEIVLFEILPYLSKRIVAGSSSSWNRSPPMQANEAGMMKMILLPR